MATNYTLAELADIEAALATGAMRVTHGGTTTEFRTRDDMIRQVRLMRSELGLPIDGSRRTPAIRRVRFLTNKGLGRFFGP
jgi:hypothetical protein